MSTDVNLQSKRFRLKLLPCFLLLIALTLATSTSTPTKESSFSSTTQNVTQNSISHCRRPSDMLKKVSDPTTNGVRRSVITAALWRLWDDYIGTGGWEASPGAPKSALDYATLLAALNTFWVANLPSQHFEAKDKAKHALARFNVSADTKIIFHSPPTELFPELVTAFALTGDAAFNQMASAIVNYTRDDELAAWPIEVAQHFLHRDNVLKNLTTVEFRQMFQKVERLFFSRFNGTANREKKEIPAWEYYWTELNLNRYSNYAFQTPVDKLNAWLGGSVDSPKLFTSAKPVKELNETLKYVSEAEGTLTTEDCAWAATLLLASAHQSDMLHLSAQAHNPGQIPELAWTSGVLRSAGQNISALCSLAVKNKGGSSVKLFSGKFTLVDENDSEKVESANTTITTTPASNFTELGSKTTVLQIVNGTGNSQLTSHLALQHFIAARTLKFDDQYRDRAWEHYLAIEEYMFCASDGTTQIRHLPKKEALIFFRETMRYLYLAFSKDFPLHKYAFTATGNPFNIVRRYSSPKGYKQLINTF